MSAAQQAPASLCSTKPVDLTLAKLNDLHRRAAALSHTLNAAGSDLVPLNKQTRQSMQAAARQAARNLAAELLDHLIAAEEGQTVPKNLTP